MYERMLDKQAKPTVADMAKYCRGSGELFTRLNDWLSGVYNTIQTITFPYGNQYGWSIFCLSAALPV